MPELPEVETTRRGLAPLLNGRRVRKVLVRNPALRWPVAIPDDVEGQRVVTVGRRAKYLLLTLETGALIVHLGMSGHLSVVPVPKAPAKHDHVDLVLDNDRVVRLTDPRRFGSIHWQPLPVEAHWLLARLGPEPLGPDFNGEHLANAARKRRTPIKSLLMDARVVVGVGNIYANEALFMAGIRPRVAAGRVGRARLGTLADAVKAVLARAIGSGGTTLRDFVAADGRPGYFARSLAVYGREGQPCVRCGTALKGLRITNRATVYCPQCQR